MLYQKCSVCQSEWNGTKILLNCPFCGKEFEIKKGNFSSVEEAFRYITLIHGSQVLRDHGTFLSLFADYAPTLEKERRVLRIVMDAGIYEKLLLIHEEDAGAREIARVKAVSTLHEDYLLDRSWAEQGINWFASYLGWIPLPQEKPVTIIPARDPFAESKRPTSPPIYQPDVKPDPQPAPYISPSTFAVGDSVPFGSYHYKRFGSSEPLIWTILEIRGEQALLWCDSCIDARPFCSYREQCTWKGSYLEYWLNLSFKAEAFSKEELDAIMEVDVRTSVNPSSGSTTGPASRNKLFILSNEELYRYHLTNDQLKCTATPYAKNRGVFCSRSGNAFYWVRTPGVSGSTCMFISSDGERNFHGNFTDQREKGVRPAMWVKLDILRTLHNK